MGNILFHGSDNVQNFISFKSLNNMELDIPFVMKTFTQDSRGENREINI